MFKPEVWNVVIQVIASWQVIAVTVVLILYVFLVAYVARLYRHPRIRIGAGKSKKQKAESAEEPVSEEDVNSELGLEEE
jgi:hypothetical protein